jgi:hypothetical protein
MAGSREHDNEPYGSIKEGNFLRSWAILSVSKSDLPHELTWLVTELDDWLIFYLFTSRMGH